MIFVDLDDGKKLLINSLNGKVDEIGAPVVDALSRWKDVAEIHPENEGENKLYNDLLAKGYLVSNDEEETARKNAVLDELRKKHAVDREKYRTITFIMTYDCNFRCPYCFEGEARVRPNVMTPEMIDAALELVGDNIEVVALFGGEPLLPKTRKAVEYIVSKLPEAGYEVTTNGYYLEEFSDLFSTVKINRLSVTLDGEEEAHNSRRYLANGKPTYHKIMDGIRVCLDKGIPIRIRMNMDERNFDECQQFRENLLDAFAYNELLSFEMSEMLGTPLNKSGDLAHQMYEADVNLPYEDLIRKNSAFREMGPIINAIIASKPIHPRYSFCYAHTNRLGVDPYGNIYTCMAGVGKDEMAVGKYYPTVKFKENSIYNRNIDKIPECRECVYSLLCGGGCPLGLQDRSDIFKPVCTPVKTGIHNLVPKFYKTKKQAKVAARL